VTRFTYGTESTGWSAYVFKEQGLLWVVLFITPPANLAAQQDNFDYSLASMIIAPTATRTLQPKEFLSQENILAIIQARMGSRRSARKCAARPSGEPVLASVINRVRRAQTITGVWLPHYRPSG
jgi:hypothetical protein